MASPFTKVVANFSTTLVTAISTGGTSATLGSNLTKEGAAIPAGKYCFTVNQGKSNEQHFVCDVSGVAITNIQGVDRLGNVTTGALKDAQINDEIKITDYVNLLRLVEVLTGIKNLDGGNPLSYDATPVLSNPLALATVQFVLDNISGGTVSFNAIKWAGIAGETLASGDWVYLKEADGRWYKTAANDTTKSRNVRIGRAMGAGTAGNSISGGVFVEGLESVGTYTLGQKYYLSNTAGALATTPGTENVLVGIGDANGKLLFLNSYDPEAVTYNEKQAIQGNVGIPSNTNRFVTQDGMSKSDLDQTQLTQNASVEVGEANSTTLKNRIAQSFIPTRSKIRGVKLYKSADTGTFTGDIVIAIYGDSGSDTPAGVLADVTITNSKWQAIGVGEFTALFAAEYAGLVTGNKYWINIIVTTSDTSNHPNFGINSAGGYANGSLRYQNTTDGWVTASTFDLYFKTMEGNANQAVQTDAAGKIPLGFFDIAKMPIPAYYQRQFITDGQSETTEASTRGCASSQDGSVIYVISSNNPTNRFHRFVRDAYTGMYRKTNSVGMTPSVNSVSSVGVVLLGSFVYVFFDNGTNMGCYRYNSADLSGETLMTTPTVALAGTQSLIAWTDGVFLYWVSNNNSGSVNKYSVSGTTLTFVSSGTADSSLWNNGMNFGGAFFDGTNVYAFGAQNGNIARIIKLGSFFGVGNTTTDYQYNSYTFGDTQAGLLGYPIDEYRMYIGKVSADNPTSTSTTSRPFVELLPLTKPA